MTLANAIYIAKITFNLYTVYILHIFHIDLKMENSRSFLEVKSLIDINLKEV